MLVVFLRVLRVLSECTRTGERQNAFISREAAKHAKKGRKHLNGIRWYPLNKIFSVVPLLCVSHAVDSLRVLRVLSERTRTGERLNAFISCGAAKHAKKGRNHLNGIRWYPLNKIFSVVPLLCVSHAVDSLRVLRVLSERTRTGERQNAFISRGAAKDAKEPGYA